MPESPAADDEAQAAAREREHLARLDAEHRGYLWNA
jgi:hypothetical protein